MANKAYNEFKNQLLRAGVNFTSDSIRLVLCMTNTTAASDVNANTIGAITTLDACDAVGYGDVTLTTPSVNEDAGGNRAYFDADDATFSALAAGTRQVAGMILYKFITNRPSSLPLCWFDTPGFPFWGNGSDVVVQWSASGVLEIA